jgi:hypothetical protein
LARGAAQTPERERHWLRHRKAGKIGKCGR